MAAGRPGNVHGLPHLAGLQAESGERAGYSHIGRGAN